MRNPLHCAASDYGTYPVGENLVFSLVTRSPYDITNHGSGGYAAKDFVRRCFMPHP
jgi:hypothetical protein